MINDACSLLDAPGESLSKTPVGGSCREEDTRFSNLFKPYIWSSNARDFVVLWIPRYIHTLKKVVIHAVICHRMCHLCYSHQHCVMVRNVNIAYRIQENSLSGCHSWVLWKGEAGKQHHESQKTEWFTHDCLHRAQHVDRTLTCHHGDTFSRCQIL